jgi:hypothetical protein
VAAGIIFLCCLMAAAPKPIFISAFSSLFLCGFQ